MSSRLHSRLSLAGIAVAGALSLTTAAIAAQPFSFGVFGDTPYSDIEEPATEQLIYEMNRDDLAFTVHVGDIKSGSSACTDEVFKSRRALFAKSTHPLVFVPGDNEWTDCWRPSAGGWDPRERLSALRRIFYGERLTLGPAPAPLGLVSQRDDRAGGCTACVEHLRWSREGVLFVTLNVTGSNNNYGRDAYQTEEYRARNAAVLRWLGASLDEARRSSARAIVMFIHANPRLERTAPRRDPVRFDGFTEFRRALAETAMTFGKPILLFHGDTHAFRDDRPLHGPRFERIDNLRRVEVPGSPIVNWVRVTVRPDSADPFEVRQGFAQPLYR